MAVPEVSETSTHGDPGFLADLGAALRVWKAHPMLPVTAVAIAGVGYFSGIAGFAVLGLAAGIAVFGWEGVKRIWYLRGFRAEPFPAKEAARLWTRFAYRYFKLVLVWLVPLVVIFVIVVAATVVARHESRMHPLSHRTGALLAAPIIAVTYTLLPFAFTALALTTNKVRDSIRIGLRMVADGWPANAPYLLVLPVVAIVTSPGWWAGSLGQVSADAINAIGTIATLAIVGAQTMFYLRRFTTGPSGSAYASTGGAAAPGRPDEEVPRPDLPTPG